jgi:hypothetical protein
LLLCHTFSWGFQLGGHLQKLPHQHRTTRRRRDFKVREAAACAARGVWHYGRPSEGGCTPTSPPAGAGGVEARGLDLGPSWARFGYLLGPIWVLRAGFGCEAVCQEWHDDLAFDQVVLPVLVSYVFVGREVGVSACLLGLAGSWRTVRFWIR